MRTLNDMVAVKPLEFAHDKGIGHEMVRGFKGTDKTGNMLIAAKVLFDSSKFLTGDTIYLKADIIQFAYVRQTHVLEIEGKSIQFILIPETAVVGVA